MRVNVLQQALAIIDQVLAHDDLGTCRASLVSPEQPVEHP